MKAVGRGLGAIVLLVGLVGAPTALAPSDAHAVIGRPLTPGSYAGVARRSSRRTARRPSAHYAAAAPAPYVTAPPPGCAMAGGVYACGPGPAYHPSDAGPEVVDVQVPSRCSVSVLIFIPPTG